MGKKCGIIPYSLEPFLMYGEYSFKEFIKELVVKYNVDKFCLTNTSSFEYDVFYNLTNYIIPDFPFVKINKDISFANEYDKYLKEHKTDSLFKITEIVYKNLIDYCDIIIFVNPNYCAIKNQEIGNIIPKKLCKVYRSKTNYTLAKKYIKDTQKTCMLFSPKIIIYDYLKKI